MDSIRNRLLYVTSDFFIFNKATFLTLFVGAISSIEVQPAVPSARLAARGRFHHLGEADRPPTHCLLEES